MNATSQKLLGFQGGNPFRESQAREYPANKATSEFYPTNIFRSLFNEQNEILVGTRGSGKTILLRMLSYTNLREIRGDAAITEIVAKKSFLGFYVPLHLELIRRIRDNPHKRVQYFTFSLNCSAAEALLNEIQVLLQDCFDDPYKRREVESEILRSLIEAWQIPLTKNPATISDFQWMLNIYYVQTPQWIDKEEDKIPVLARSVLMPIRFILQRLTRLLCLDENNTQWLACIDEAEFLPEIYIQALNTFLRSEKRPLTVKIATLPFEHSTRDTLEVGTKIEPDGNDFNYRKIDYDPDSDDFRHLTNHIVRVRLSKCQIETSTLEEFVGVVGQDEGIDYYRLEFGETESSREKVLDKIRESLPSGRIARFDRLRSEPTEMNQQYLKKYSPVLYVREMRKADSDGNRAVGWFAGAKIFRRVADGNSRRFIQLMNELVQCAIEKDLSPRNQHRVTFKFCRRTNAAIPDLPKHGLLAKECIDSVGKMLCARTHDGPLYEAGCEFKIDVQLLGHPDVQDAFQTAVAYSHVILPDTVFDAINANTHLRLSYLNAVCYWLPMRKGDPAPRLKAGKLQELAPLVVAVPSADEAAVARVRDLQMTLELPLVDNGD